MYLVMEKGNTQQLLEKLEAEKKARKKAEALLEQKNKELELARLVVLDDHKNLIKNKGLLEASEQRYRQIVESASDIIYKVDNRGHITFANAVAVSRLKMPLEKIIGKHIFSFIHPDFRENYIARLNSIMASQTREFYWEIPIMDIEGERIWMGENVQMNYQNGQFREAISVSRDITSRKKVEDILFKTKLTLSNLISNLQSGAVILDENKNIIFANQIFCSEFNLIESPDQLAGRNFLEILELMKPLFNDPAAYEEDLVQLFKEGATSTNAAFKTIDDRTLAQNYVPIKSEGQLVGHLLQFRDETIERRAQNKLRQSEEKYRGILENLELGLIELDIEGRIIKAYQRYCTMTGYKESELAGRVARDFLVPEEFYPILKEQKLNRLQGKPGTYEIQLIRKDGERIWVMVSGAPIYNAKGVITGLVGIHLDISERKKIEQELKEAKLDAEMARDSENQFLANMSHEIRTPLNAIIGMTHLLYDTQPTNEQKRFLEVLKNSSGILHSLINDILDISKIRAGKAEVTKKEFGLKGLINTMKETFKLKLEGKPVAISADIDPRLDTLLIGDDLMLNQILMNLLSNAEKFTAEGKIGICIKKKQQTGRQVWVQIEVYDTGIGIAAEKLELIFQNFRQVDGDIKRRYGGTGLGLAIVKNLVELQGGNIQVYSELGAGTTFTVELAYEDTGVKDFLVNNLPNRFDTTRFFNNCSVLVVEDNFMNRRYISTLLKKWDIPFNMAVNGKQGLDWANKKRYDAILLDIHMPVMDGYETAIAIRNATNLNRDTPIIALTATVLKSQKDLAFKVGMNDYLSKPFTPQQFHEVLQKYIAPEALPPIKGAMLDEEANGGFSFSSKLDAAYLQEIYGQDTAYANSIFEVFREKMLMEYANLQPLFAKKQWPEFAKLAHKLKPSFPMVGLTWLEKHFQTLEDEAGSPNPDIAKITFVLSEVENEIQAAIPIIEEEFFRLKEA